jgi:hypothetical protein
MPKGLKQTSSLIEISFELTESAPNTFTQERVDLQLNPLDNEVFIVYAANLDPFNPDAIAATDTAVLASVTSTSQTQPANLSVSNCIATATKGIRAAGFVDGGVAFENTAGETPPTTLEYVGIIATNDFFVQVQGVANLAAKAVAGRLYGVRAKADASIYAALVQSEVLSS